MRALATQHTTINSTNKFSWPTNGITSCKIADAKDPHPSINDDIVDTADLFPFKYGYCDRSIATAEDIMLYGPPKNIPIKKMIK